MKNKTWISVLFERLNTYKNRKNSRRRIEKIEDNCVQFNTAKSKYEKIKL